EAHDRLGRSGTVERTTDALTAQVSELLDRVLASRIAGRRPADHRATADTRRVPGVRAARSCRQHGSEEEETDSHGSQSQYVLHFRSFSLSVKLPSTIVFSKRHRTRNFQSTALRTKLENPLAKGSLRDFDQLL